MEILTKEKLNLELQDIYNLCCTSFIKSSSYDYKNPSFGELWICKIPVLINNDGNITFITISRPVLVIDDCHEHLVKKDTKNYYILKITSQKDSYQRIKLKDYLSLGLQKESYIRIELPIKAEREQFLYRIGTISKEESLKYLKIVLKSFK